MQDASVNLIQLQPDSAQLAVFASRLRGWLVADLNRSSEPVPEFTESRAKALLRAADMLDEPTRQDFENLVTNSQALRIALYDLLQQSEVGDEDEVAALAATAAATEGTGPVPAVDWLSLAIAAFAFKRGYPLFQLDPAAPPDIHSPAGQVLKRAAYWMRQQVQRSATERDKLGRQLAYSSAATASGGTPSLDNLPATQQPIAPVPPHFRSPVPVRYPEVARETLHVEPDEPPASDAPVQRGDPITITPEDLSPSGSRSAPVRQPQITITNDQLTQPRPAPAPAPRANVSTSSTTAVTGASFGRSIRKTFGRGHPPMKSTRLHVVVQEYPDGPGLYGLQVKVMCKGIKSYVAGTTNREGKFVCQLPVPQDGGLTYDVDITWPREMDSETERKSVTLNADRTQFTLPFYRRLSKDEAGS